MPQTGNRARAKAVPYLTLARVSIGGATNEDKMKKLALALAALSLLATVANAGPYGTTCRTTCVGNTCTTNCY